jgi:pro-apoptotic serine protease NMA111
VAEAIFLNREELPVYPLYYDPVHDYGFLRFDPSKLKASTIVELVLLAACPTVSLAA